MSRLSVLILDAETHFSIRVARCLLASGKVTLHGLSRQPSTSLRHSSLYSTLSHSTDGPNPARWLEQIDEIVAAQDVDVVLPVADFGIRTLGEHGHLLRCVDRLAKLPDPRTFDVATNKASLASFLSAHDLPQPHTVLLTAGSQSSDALSTITFPILVKAPHLAGGQGIQRCETRGELDAFLEDKRESGTWIVQELIEGRDLGVNVFSQNGKIIASTVQHAIDSAVSSYKPANGFAFRTNGVAMDIAKRLIEKLSWTGVANIDMRFDSKRGIPVVLELNGRFWTTLLGSMSAGINFPLLVCETVADLPLSNRIPHDTRYFRGKGSVLVSMIGGGKHRIRPSETDLRYLVGDPLRFVQHLTRKVVTPTAID